MEVITLNLIPTGVRPICHVSQDDNERGIRINLIDGGPAYSIKTGDTIYLNVKKPNNHVVTTLVSSTAGNTFVEIEVDDDMCDVNGENICDLQIVNGNTRIGTSNFSMVVEANPANGGGGGGGASSLSELSDVSLSSPTNGQVLAYDSSVSKWKNANGGGGVDSYTKAETDALLGYKADKATTYTKTEIDGMLILDVTNVGV